jgi:ABC-type antimicrobial peptide transport system permease subunit
MLIFDLIRLGLANLWRTRLRTFLTILGVIVGVGALSSMVSFGIGMQKNITESFRKNDLFTSLQVTTRKIDLNALASGNLDSLTSQAGKEQALTDSLVQVISALKGVSVAFPELQFPVQVRFRGKETTTNLQLLPSGMSRHYPFNELLAGQFYSSDSDKVVIVRSSLLKQLGITLAESASAGSADTAAPKPVAAASLTGDTLEVVTVVFDIHSVMRNPFMMLMGSGNLPVKDSVLRYPIGGILPEEMEFAGNRFQGGAVIPMATGRKLPNLGFSSVWDIVGKTSDNDGYGSVYVRVFTTADQVRVKKQLEAMGLNVFALSDQLKEIKQAFLVMDSLLGAIGFIALFVAALGIINTLLMSILERTREIGIMKSIGGSEGEIRTIFFTEAATIGLIGAVFGLITGWLVTRVANTIINARLKPEDLPQVDLFYFPWWLILGATAFSVILSLAAGLYPAGRAARIDPVSALRHD